MSVSFPPGRGDHAGDDGPLGPSAVTRRDLIRRGGVALGAIALAPFVEWGDALAASRRGLAPHGTINFMSFEGYDVPGPMKAWKKKYGGLHVNEARRLKTLEEENRQLKRLVADQALNLQVVKDLLGKKW